MLFKLHSKSINDLLNLISNNFTTIYIPKTILQKCHLIPSVQDYRTTQCQIIFTPILVKFILHVFYHGRKFPPKKKNKKEGTLVISIKALWIFQTFKTYELEVGCLETENKLVT